MAVLVKNNAFSTLASGITAIATTITVAAGTGSRFPAAGGADYFYATLIDTSNNLEVVKVTSRSTDTLTVVRGQDGTTGRIYSSGARIELRVTAALLADIRDSITPADGTVTTAKIVDANVTLAKLAAAVQALLVPTGTVAPYAGTAEPTGWLFCRGQEVLRSTYSALDTLITTTYGAYTNGSGGAGTSHFRLPDLRGRVVAGQDDMGGTSANRLTGLSGGVDGDVLGAAGGAETHTLTEAQLAAHRHLTVVDTVNTNVSPTASNSIVKARSSGGDGNYVIESSTSEPTLSRTSVTGSGAAHNNVQPTIILNYIIKT
jgi:microcystin-dependent protein